MFLVLNTRQIYDISSINRNVSGRSFKKVSAVGKHPACGQGALTRIPAIWQIPVGKATKNQTLGLVLKL